MRRLAVMVSTLGALAQPWVAPAVAQPEDAPPSEAPAPPSETPAAASKVTGRVIDAMGRPVANAKVGIDGSAVRVKTDRGGRFTLEAAPGTTLIAEARGFEPAFGLVGENGVDDIVALTAAELGETIEIVGDTPTVAPGAASLDRQELQRVPGTGGDLVKALTVMPGVVNLQIPLGYSGVVVRGASPQDSKVLIDDFEVPVLFHNIGFRAIVPAETISSLDFIAGGFDVAHGRATSGVVLLNTRGGADKTTGQAEISLIDGGLVAEGTIGKKTRYLVGIRRSVIDLVLPALIPDDVDLSLTTVPRYWDEQLRIDHQLSSKWSVQLSSLGTDDIFEIVASKQEDAEQKRFFNRTRFIRNTVSARWRSGEWSAKLALSGLLQQFVFEIGREQFIDVRPVVVTPRFEITRDARSLWGLKDVVWRVGAEAPIGRASIRLASSVETREGEPMPEIDFEDTSVQFRGTIWTPNFAAWTSAAANFDQRVRLQLGLRADVFGRPEQVALQPRGELSVKLAKPWTARLAAGGYRRPPEYQSEYLEKHLKAESSAQTIAGLEWKPGEGAKVQASTYYIHRSALITRNPDGTLGNQGVGTSVGGELLGTYRGGPWFAWLSYSYSHSTRVDRPGAPERLFSFDQPHSMNAAVSWKRGKWQLGGRFQLYSGLPYTPPIGAVFDSDRNVYVPIYGEVNGERAPIHHQLDLRVDRSWRWGPIGLTGFIDVQNVYLNESVVTYFYSYDYSERIAFKSLPLIPSLGIRGVW